ncbi:MAG: RecQ family ATP-dependent DNA helicase [Cyanobacteria bacterium RI_101]|nr:RecQ family ATP-dependent DNA helicase [Cyanobacteria bacterium RI_101]
MERREVLAQLQKIWGYGEFRYPQGEVVDCLLQGRDALAILPTGAGKSLCFQLPALLRSGLTLVVSPLIALMENQVQELREKGLGAACLHSELPRPKRRELLKQIENQAFRLLYLAPETLLSLPVWEILRKPSLQLRGLMLDEAHCLVQWGDSFRPAYRRLGILRSALAQTNPSAQTMALAAFTGTADAATEAEISQALQLRDPQIFRLSAYRPHLALTVKTVWSERCRWHLLREQVRRYSGQGGLIYVRTRGDSLKLAQRLEKEKIKTAAYHGGLGAQERRRLENLWLKGQLPFVVCTNAFGLGINKPDVRWILHYHPPLLLAEYLQEVGRAGRDLKPADCLTLISEPTGWLDPGDRQRRRYFQDQQKEQRRQAQALLSQIPPRGNLLELKPNLPDLEFSLALLHRQGRLDWLDPFNYRLRPQVAVSQNPTPLAELTPYLKTRRCRWLFLLAALGENIEKLTPCGRCDNCLPEFTDPRYGTALNPRR